MATFTNLTKNSASWTNTSKNAASWTNNSISTSAGLWSALTLPWQELLPWQFSAGGAIITWTNANKN